MCKKNRNKMNLYNSEEISKLNKIVKELPDIRQDKIDEIKRKIESGEYKIDGKEIAKKMFEIHQDIKKMSQFDKNRNK
ncbi:TPA: flagellar biosynthesis anti-sigma factor FlgM [Candidatus Poribacteria bacterium]|nr:flagellar biosynthesis anti-sigma factor FlgM [Candidatus Poribacteria bacterium]